MNNLLISTIPFKGTLNESTSSPGVYEVVGVMQRAGSENQNGRIYKKELLEREVEKYIESFVKVGNAYGELDHPESPVVSLKNASHVVKDLWWENDTLMGKVQLLNTPSGNIVKSIIEGGHTVGISSRGTGSVKQTNEGTLLVQPDFELCAWDFVSNPSTRGGFMRPNSLNENVEYYNRYSRLDLILNSILRD